MINSEERTRKVLNLVRQGVESNSERNRRQGPTCKRGEHLEDAGSNTGRSRPRDGPNWAQAGRSSPFRGPIGLSFDLIASQAINSPLTESHAGTEVVIRRRGAEKLEGHHLGDDGRASCLGFP
jgi:hypothetical protein